MLSRYLIIGKGVFERWHQGSCLEKLFLPSKNKHIEDTANRLKGMFCSFKHDIDLNKDINCLNGYMGDKQQPCLLNSVIVKGIFKNIEDATNGITKDRREELNEQETISVKRTF